MPDYFILNLIRLLSSSGQVHFLSFCYYAPNTDCSACSINMYEMTRGTWLSHLVECATFGLGVVGSSTMLGTEIT